MTDDAKKTILSRRARFVAAAIAGLGVACGKERAAPCLSATAMEPEADAGTPAPCLSVYNPPPDAAPPRPCLSPRVIHRDAGAKTCDPDDPLCEK